MSDVAVWDYVKERRKLQAEFDNIERRISYLKSKGKYMRSGDRDMELYPTAKVLETRINWITQRLEDISGK